MTITNTPKDTHKDLLTPILKTTLKSWAVLTVVFLLFLWKAETIDQELPLHIKFYINSYGQIERINIAVITIYTAIIFTSLLIFVLTFNKNDKEMPWIYIKKLTSFKRYLLFSYKKTQKLISYYIATQWSLTSLSFAVHLKFSNGLKGFYQLLEISIIVTISLLLGLLIHQLACVFLENKQLKIDTYNKHVAGMIMILLVATLSSLITIQATVTLSAFIVAIIVSMVLLEGARVKI